MIRGASAVIEHRCGAYHSTEHVRFDQMGTKKSTSKPLRRKSQSRPLDLSNPETVEHKIISAKSIVTATMATLDNDTNPPENFDPHWTLSAAVRMLDQGIEQLDRERLSAARSAGGAS